MKNNKGFSLLEAIVAVTIASAVGIAVFGFMVVGAQSFNSSSSDVNVQHESQLVFNQIQELIVDTNVGLEYTDTDPTEKILTMYNYDAADLSRHVYEVVWNKDEEKIYYNEYTPSVADDGSGGKLVSKGASICTGQLLGENITDFSADLSAMDKKRVVRLDLAFRKRRTEYKSSHNITLRNEIVVGGTIPNYVDPPSTSTVDPERITGLTTLWAEPGQVLDMAGLGGYKVKAPGGADYPDQDIRFFILNDAECADGTSVSTSGTLTLSKAQKKDFVVTVATRSGKGTPLSVNIKLLLVLSVDVDFVSRDDNKDKNDDFAQRASFTLKATVNRLHKEAEAPEFPQWNGITWSLSPEAEKYVTMGTASADADGSTCSFTMKTGFTIDNAEKREMFKIIATSVRSVQIPYYDGASPKPVEGEFTGWAMIDKGDFEIVAKGSLKRGVHTPNEVYVGLVNNQVTGIEGFKTDGHVLFAGVKVNELAYYQTETTPSTSYILRRDVQDNPTAFYGGGTHLGIKPPNVNEDDPNTALEYEITFYIFDARPGDPDPNWQNLRVFQPGQTVVDGYDIANYKYRSNTVTQFCDRLHMYFNSQRYGKNDDDTIDYSHWTGDMSAQIRPRATGHLNWGSWEETVTLIDSDNTQSKGIQNVCTYKTYRKVNDTWVEYDASREFSFSNGELLKLEHVDNGMKVRFNPDHWEENWANDYDVPDTLRIVPVVRYSKHNEQKEAPLFDNFIEVYLWNMKLPVVEGYKIGFKEGKTQYTRTYFPTPMDPEFYFIRDNRGNQEWKHPYSINDSTNRENLKNLSFYYRLTYAADGNNYKTWYLQVMYRKNGELKTIARYMCGDDERVWKQVSGNIPDSVRNDFEKQ